MFPRRIGLRWIAVALTLSIVAPLGVLSVLSIQRAWRRQLANVERQNVATARAVSVAIDNDIETTVAALNVFGALHALDVPDISAFDSLARRLIVRQPEWSALLLSDLNGRVIAVAPQGDVNEAGSFASGWAQAVATSRQPIVSKLFEMPGVHGHFLMIGVPIVRDGRVKLALGARLRSEGLSEILRRQQVAPNGAVSLVDAGYHIVARTRDEKDYVGTPVSDAYIELLKRTREGTWTTETRNRMPVYAAYSTSTLTGLTVGVTMPREDVDGPIRRILGILASSWVVILAVGTGLGLTLGQVIVRAMRGASQSAMALARGEPVSPPPSRIAEIDDLSTGLRLAAQTLEVRNRERDEASRLKDEFLMTVSHELRTPLTAIYGWARMLSTGQIRDAQRPRAIDAIERNAAALQQLVDDLLDVSRIVSGRLRLDVQAVHLPDVVGAAIDAIRPAADAKNIQVVPAIDGDETLSVSGDAGRLQQVIWNLLSNAVRFTPNDGRIDIAVARTAATLTVTVRDTGPGIDAAFLPHAFERFRQGAAGTTRAHGGLGLGLAIVRHLVELHGGSVEAMNNTLAPGAWFRITLPARVVAAVAANAEPAVARLGGNRAAQRIDGVRVLVTDDDMNARELLAVILGNAGADVRAAASAEDALMILQTWVPDVVLSDIEMPGEDGYGLIERVRRLATGGERLVAIALTAHARPEDRARALQVGFQWHLAKPVDPGELLSVIVTLLAQEKGLGDPKIAEPSRIQNSEFGIQNY